VSAARPLGQSRRDASFPDWSLLVKVQIAPAAKSTLANPLFVWRLYDGGRQVAWGTAGNEEEAAKQAETARSQRREPAWRQPGSAQYSGDRTHETEHPWNTRAGPFRS
jgi:hypothetical protein